MTTATSKTTMTASDRIEMVQDAQEKLREAIKLIRQATAGHPTESNTKAYIVDHLRILTSEGHGFLSRDKNLDDVITELRENEGGCDCGEMDFRWDDEAGEEICWECGASRGA